MGKFDNCCCCLSKKTSAIICTVIMIIIAFYQVYSDYDYIKSIDLVNGYYTQRKLKCNKIEFHSSYKYISMFVHFILGIYLVLLIFGIIKPMISLVKPFKYIFGIYLSYYIVSISYAVITTYKWSKSIANMDIDAELEEFFKDNQDIHKEGFAYQLFSYNYHELCKSSGNTSQVVGVLVLSFVITFAFYLVYYITTKNYIDSVEQENKEVDDIRNVENAN